MSLMSGSQRGLGPTRQVWRPSVVLNHSYALQLRHSPAPSKARSFRTEKLGLRDPRVSKQQRCVSPKASLDSVIHAITDTPLRDVLAVTGSIIGAKVLVGIFETLEENGIMDKKLSRKMVHTLAGPLFLVCWPLFSSAPYAQYLAALVPSLNGIRLILAGTELVKDPRAVAAMTRTGDPAELLRGPLYYVIVLLSVTALYWRDSPVGLVVTSLMCGGDGLADIFGRRFGKTNPLPWNPEKSWAGTTAMFLGGLSMSLGLLWYFNALGYLNLDVGATAAAVVVIAGIAAAIESLPINKMLDDNLSVPGIAAVLGTVMLVTLI